MISSVLSIAIDGYAALDRRQDRRLYLTAAAQRVDMHGQRGVAKSLVIVRHPNQLRSSVQAKFACKDPLLPHVGNFADGSCVVFVDCALELCDDEADLKACWAEVLRICGREVFVLRLQKWASGRRALDPRVRWLITCAPPVGELAYEPYGKRSTVLAEALVRGRARKAERTEQVQKVATAGK